MSLLSVQSHGFKGIAVFALDAGESAGSKCRANSGNGEVRKAKAVCQMIARMIGLARRFGFAVTHDRGRVMLDRNLASARTHSSR